MISRDVIEAAQTAQEKYGVPASISIAQYALESSWGHAEPLGSNNPFGIKAVAGQPFVSAKTHEFLHGRYVTVTAKFRKFQDLAAAFEAHAQLLAEHSAYHNAMSHKDNAEEFAQALTGVYATDPHYGQKLIQIMDEYNLKQYDKG